MFSTPENHQAVQHAHLCTCTSVLKANGFYIEASSLKEEASVSFVLVFSPSILTASLSHSEGIPFSRRWLDASISDLSFDPAHVPSPSMLKCVLTQGGALG